MKYTGICHQEVNVDSQVMVKCASGKSLYVGSNNNQERGLGDSRRQ